MKILSFLYLLVASIIPVAARRLSDTTSTGNLVEELSKIGSLSTLVDLVAANNLTDTLATGGEFTVFAPSNNAFEKVLSRLNKLTPEQVVEVLLYHVVSGKVLSDDLSDGQVVPTLRNGSNVKVSIEENSYFWSSYDEIHINDSKVISDNQEASNGVFHVIDEVLIPEDLVSNSVVDVLGDYDMFSTLVGLLDTYNLTDTVKSAPSLTIVAPSNDAFSEIENKLKRLTGDEGAAKVVDILTYHVLGSAVKSDDLVDGQSYATLYPNDTIQASVTEKSYWWWKWITVKLNDVTVFKADIEGTNGVIHAVNQVLLPPSVEIPNTIVDIAGSEDDFSTLVGLLVEANLVDTLKATGPFTVFAPTNDAFSDIQDILDTLTVEQKKEVLLYHVVGGAKTFSSDLSDGQSLTTIDTNSVSVSISSCSWYQWHCTSSIKINESKVIKADIEGTNGIIHVIDKVLIPPSLKPPNTIVDIAVSKPEFSTLVGLLGEANLVDTLKTPGPFTVFAPTNDAFSKIEDTLNTLTAAQKINVLLYHVVGAKAFSGDLSDGQQLETKLAGEKVVVSLQKSGGWLCEWFGLYCETTVKINQSEVTTADIDASNGVIHVIDNVLIPANL